MYLEVSKTGSKKKACKFQIAEICHTRGYWPMTQRKVWGTWRACTEAETEAKVFH